MVGAHREENVDSPDQLLKLANSLNTIAEHFDLPVIVSTHLDLGREYKVKALNFIRIFDF